MRPNGIAERLPGLWYRPRLALALAPMLPLSWLFGLLVRLRRSLYRHGILLAYRLPVPVIVISADAKTTHQSVVDIMQAAQMAGYPHISFATQAPR